MNNNIFKNYENGKEEGKKFSDLKTFPNFNKNSQNLKDLLEESKKKIYGMYPTLSIPVIKDIIDQINDIEFKVSKAELLNKVKTNNTNNKNEDLYKFIIGSFL